MSLKAITDKEAFEKLLEAEQQHYVEKDDKYYLEVDKVENLELTDPTSLKSALQKERKAVKEAVRASKKLEETITSFEGLDPEGAREALKKVKEMDDWDPEKKLEEHKKSWETQVTEKFKKEQAELTTKQTAELDAAKVAQETAESALRKAKIGTALVEAINTAEGSVRILKPALREQIRMVKKDNGEYVVEVLDVDGEPRLSPEASSTKPMTIDELVAEYKADTEFAPAFKGTGSTGSGAGGTSDTPPGINVKTIRYSDQEAIDANLEDIASGKITVVEG